MIVDIVTPWDSPEWDAYVSEHPGARVYHTASWCSVVRDVGGYTPLCLAAVDGGRVRGVLPVMEIRSRLTGNRITTLPFSDECYAIADDDAAAAALVKRARGMADERGVDFYEMRGEPAVRNAGGFDVASLGFACQSHFADYHIELSEDTDAVRRTFSRKSVRQTINQGFKRGVTVRRGGDRADLEAFYRLYVLNRSRHGIPPQPLDLFELIFERLQGDPEALLYVAEIEGQAVAALVVLRYREIAYAKYEGVDEAARRALPVYPLFWTSIEEAAKSGYKRYHFGRTAADNPGLNDFKRRWGTVPTELPYFLHPPAEALSVVRRDSLKYRAFTGAFRRLPPWLAIRIGKRIFHHFG
jgi:CelD/BcsL family acetyltransferase involved in cellulose biosynthesis